MSVQLIIQSFASNVTRVASVAFAPGRNRAITLATSSAFVGLGLALGSNRCRQTQARPIQIIDVPEKWPTPASNLKTTCEAAEVDNHCASDSDDDDVDFFDAVEEFFPLYDLPLAQFRRGHKDEYAQRLRALNELLDGRVLSRLLVKEEGKALKKVFDRLRKIGELFIDAYSVDGAWPIGDTADVKKVHRKDTFNNAFQALWPLVESWCKTGRESEKLERLLQRRLNFGRLCQIYLLCKDETLDDHQLMMGWKEVDRSFREAGYPVEANVGWKGTLRSGLAPVANVKYAAFSAVKKLGLWGWSSSKKIAEPKTRAEVAYNGAIDYASAVGGVVLDLVYDQSDLELFDELWKNIPDFCAGKPIRAKVRIQAIEWMRTHPSKSPPMKWASALERVLEACFAGNIHGFGLSFRREELTDEDHLFALYDLLDLLHQELEKELAH